MHALLAHAYHLLLLPAHLAARPLWRSLAVCVAAALAGRLFWTPRAAAVFAAVPVIAAWAVLAWVQDWPPAPVARLTGMGAIVLAGALTESRGLTESRAPSWGRLWALAAVLAWWLRGAPFGLAGIAGCVPVMFGLAGGFAVADRLTAHETTGGVVAGAVVLAAGLWLAGAAPHWAHAALVPACAAAVLRGRPGAAPLLARSTVCVAVAALVASDRGRVLKVDLACFTPLLVWAALLSRARKPASA